MAIDKVKIFPSIGIARLGNSPNIFVGPEIPGNRNPPAGGYKDSHCRVKRQAARFRLFGYDGNTLVQEITSADATITWTAHLANTKASWHPFIGPSQSAGLRNAGIADRASLEIDPGGKSITGPNQAAGFNTGTFLGKTVALGEMRTEADGRLLILGGFGNSGSVPPDEAITNYANNEKWYDDVSDGPINSTVTLNGTTTPIVAEPAWVLCAPPDFAPPVDSLTTLYDTLLQTAIDNGLPGVSEPPVPSFIDDIFPILQRVFDLIRVTDPAGSGHFDFDGASAAAMSATRRQSVFNRIRDPNNPGVAGSANMPKLWDDSNGFEHIITKTQYNILQKWTGAEGTAWVNDWLPSSPPTPPSTVDPTKPEDLTRAALEACVGAALYPGIEASWLLREIYAFTEPFRLDHTGRSAGDVSKQMAVPWQADFWKCRVFNSAPDYAWWPAQRPDDVFPEGGGGSQKWTKDVIFDHVDMVDHWHKLGFVVDQGGSLVETEKRVVCRSLTLVTDRSHVSEDEVAGVLSAGVPAEFNDSFYVIAEGFLPAELGVTTANPTPAQLVPIAPGVEFRRADNTPVPGMSEAPRQLLLQDANLPANLRQRFTFVYRIEFANVDGFSVGGNPVESQTVTLTATKNAGATGTFTTAGFMTLFHQPNPYMLDGPTHWLSTDVRVFQITGGESRFGQNMGSTDAAAGNFIASVVNDFNGLAPAGHPFDGISTDQQASRLELSRSVDGDRVFNFAIARVRYRGNVLDADDVRVMFRLFTTAATGLDYNENTTYRRSSGASPIALLGLQGGHVVTIPCYGDPRIDSTTVSLGTQNDSLNLRTLVHAGAQERHGYFGCWLDFNQTTLRFPIQPMPDDGPWTSGLKSVQELIRGAHQCLVAEVYFQGDPIATGASPASNDNLSQRNLAIVESDNPGSAATHTVQHTFEIKASHRIPRTAPLVAPPADGDVEFARPQKLPPGPDEVMIRWNDLPRSSQMTLYMPDVDTDEVLRYAGQNYEALRLERVDAHTLRCLSADVTYVPLPFGRTRNIAALLTVELPEEISRKQIFNVVVQQISGRPRRVLGAFQLTIPVSTKSALLEPEIRKLSVLRHIARAIPNDDQWRPVFDRYLGQIEDRVRGFGGEPDEVEPSPDGTGIDAAIVRCRQLGWINSLLLALFIIVAAVHPLANYAPEFVVAIGLAAAAWLWHRRCSLSRCHWVVAAIFGLGLGAAGAALLSVTGFAAQGSTVAVLTGLALGVTVSVGAWWRCLRVAGN